MGPRSDDGHHPNCPEGHPEGCECLRCRLFKADEILGDSIANKVSHWHGRLEEASQKSIAEYHQTIVEAVEDTGGGFFLDVAGENVAWANYVIAVKQKAAERVKLHERAFRAIVKAARREVYWGLPEVGRVAEEALKGENTFLNMLEFQGETSRQRKRDELQVVSRQTFDEFAAWVKEKLEAMGAKEKGDEGGS
jgi:hypothetical protein